MLVSLVSRYPPLARVANQAYITKHSNQSQQTLVSDLMGHPVVEGYKSFGLKVHDDPEDPVPEEADVGEAPEGDGQPAAAEGAAERDHAVDLPTETNL